MYAYRRILKLACAALIALMVAAPAAHACLFPLRIHVDGTDVYAQIVGDDWDQQKPIAKLHTGDAVCVTAFQAPGWFEIDYTRAHEVIHGWIYVAAIHENAQPYY